MDENKDEKKKKKKDNRIRRRLSFKMTVLLVAFAVILTAGILLIGARGYQKAIVERYNTTAYQMAETSQEYFSISDLYFYTQKLEEYNKGELTEEQVTELTSAETYQNVKRLITTLRENLIANDIYVCVIDQEVLANFSQEARDAGTWKPITYIMDCYNDPTQDLKFGDRSGVLPEFRQDIMKIMETGEVSSKHFITDSKYGYNISAIRPVVYQGKTIAAIGVEIPMQNLEEDVIGFIISISSLAVGLLIVALIISVLLTKRMVVRPVRLVAEEANRFISEDATVSDRLGTIRSGDEIQMLSESLLAMELSINDYIDNIQRITAEKERIGAELNVATKIQADMLPRIFPAFPEHKEFELYATMNPAKEVGGDFYDYFMVDEVHLALVIADVSGKGVPAALFMVISKTLIKNRTQIGGGTPGEILTEVNNQLCEGNEAELFVTVWLAIIDIRTGEGQAANAGHEHPALRHADGSFELIKYRHSPAVATMEDMPFRSHEFKLEPGDTLYVYTDGVTEATDANNELFGEERLTEALNREPNATPEKLLANVKESIDTFVGEAPQFDDVTMLGFKYFG